MLGFAHLGIKNKKAHGERPRLFLFVKKEKFLLQEWKI
jgi:hypothetical protein